MANLMTRSAVIQIKRIYDPPSDDDGFRVLVDRLWPRGVKKENARIDLWAKEIAPTTELRKWFDHDTKRFDEFRTRYLRELAANEDVANQIVEDAADKSITLLFAARDRSCNHVVVLQEFLSERRGA